MLISGPWRVFNTEDHGRVFNTEDHGRVYHRLYHGRVYHRLYHGRVCYTEVHGRVCYTEVHGRVYTTGTMAGVHYWYHGGYTPFLVYCTLPPWVYTTVLTAAARLYTDVSGPSSV